MSDQKLLSNKDLLARNFDEVIVNLDECDNYIQSIIVSVFLSYNFVALALANMASCVCSDFVTNGCLMIGVFRTMVVRVIASSAA